MSRDNNHLLFEFFPVENNDSDKRFSHYIRRIGKGEKLDVTFDRVELYSRIAPLISGDITPEQIQDLGWTMRSLMETAGFRDDHLHQDQKKASRFHIYSASDEIYSLPLECTVTAAGVALGNISNVSFRYSHPGITRNELGKLTPDDGRILFAWSDAGGHVPFREHLSAISRAKPPWRLDPRDTIPDFSIKSLSERLSSAMISGPPVRILHILCHGSRIDGTFGIAAHKEHGTDHVSGLRLATALAPFSDALELVVLCTCNGGNIGRIGNRVGSIARNIHARGIWWVLSSRYLLSTDGSTTLCESLYENLPPSLEQLDRTVTSVRIRLRGACAEPDWASLQLFEAPLRNTSRLDTKSPKDPSIVAELQYSSVRQKLNNWFRASVSSSDQTRRHYRQKIRVSSSFSSFTPRRMIGDKLDQWWKSWEDNKRPAVLLGEEGYGKTWCIADWLDKLVSDTSAGNDDFPIVFFLSSNLAIETTDFSALLTRYIDRIVDVGPRGSNQLVQSWRGIESRAPRLLVVLDGLNEKSTNDWLGLLRDIFANPGWSQSTALLMTCRPSFYNERLRNRPITAGFQEILVEGYDNNELSIGIRAHGIEAELPGPLLEFARIPMYLGVIATYWSNLKSINELTPERLIYEEHSQRIRRKDSTPDHATLDSIVHNLANRYRFNPSLRIGDLRKTVEEECSINIDQLVEEIKNSSIVSQTGGPAARYQLTKHYLVYGMGLCLLHDVQTAISDTGDCDIELWLEPNSSSDLKTSICHAALMWAVLSDDDSVTGGTAVTRLLQHCAGMRNLSLAHQRSICSYIVQKPDAFIDACEWHWSQERVNTTAEQIFRSSFEENIDILLEQHHKKTLRTLEDWISAIPISGLIHKTGSSEQKKHQKEIENRLGAKLEIGRNSALRIVERDSFARLSRIAIGCILSTERPYDFRTAIVKWIFSREAIRYYPSLELKTLKIHLRRAADSYRWLDLYDLIDSTIPSNSSILSAVRQRAANLLWDNDAISSRRERIWEDKLFDDFRADPCTGHFAWWREDCENCIEREDVPLTRIMREIAPYSGYDTYKNCSTLSARLQKYVDTVNPSDLIGEPALVKHFYAATESVFCALKQDCVPALSAKLVNGLMTLSHEEIIQLRGWLAFRFFALSRETALPLIRKIRAMIAPHVEEYRRDRAISGVYRALDCELFGAELFHISGNGKHQAIIAFPHNFEPARWGLLLKLTAPPDFDSLFERLACEDSPTVLYRTLWILSELHAPIPAEHRARIQELILHPDDTVRGTALQCVYKSGDRSLAKWFFEQANSIHNTHKDFTAWWALKAISVISDEQTVIDSLDAIDIYGCMELLCADQPAPSMVKYVSSRLLIEWAQRFKNIQADSSTQHTRLIFSVEPSWDEYLPPGIDFDRLFENQFRVSDADFESGIENEQKKWEAKESESWHDIFFPSKAFVAALNESPCLAQKWTSATLSTHPDKKQTLLRELLGFYAPLCKAMLEVSPSNGALLLDFLFPSRSTDDVRHARIKGRLGTIPIRKWILFGARSESREVEKLREHELTLASCDYDLYLASRITTKGDNHNWLLRHIRDLCASSSYWEKGRGITLASLSHIRLHDFNVLAKSVFSDNVLSEIRKITMLRAERNAAVDNWIVRVEESRTNGEFFANFRTLLNCADGRLYLRTLPGPLTKSMLNYFESTARSCIREKEEKYQETLLGMDIQHVTCSASRRSTDNV